LRVAVAVGGIGKPFHHRTERLTSRERKEVKRDPSPGGETFAVKRRGVRGAVANEQTGNASK